MTNRSENKGMTRKELAQIDDGWGKSTPSKKTSYSRPPNKRRKAAIIPFLLGLCLILIILGIIIYLFNKTSFKQEGRSLPLKTTEKVVEHPVGARKLRTPLFGKSEDTSQAQDKNIPNLSNEFDFTPLDDLPIERIPVLPKKYIKEKEANEFEALWQDDKSKKGLNISKDEYDTLTMQDLQKVSHSYLPTWKANAAYSTPINAKSIYALVINYDPQTLPIDALPKGFPLTIAIDGYTPDAQDTVDNLRKAGFEVILNLPIEIDKSLGVHAGLKPISSNMSYETIETYVKWHAGSVTGHIGFKNKLSSPVLGELEKMNYMMHQLKELGLTFLEVDDPMSEYRSVAYATAETAGIPTRKTAHILNKIDGEFQNFLKSAIKIGSGVAVINADEKNMVLMSHILDKLKEQKEIGLVYLSRIYASDQMKEMKISY